MSDRRTMARRKGPGERRSGVERRQTAHGPLVLDGPATERTRKAARRADDKMLTVIAAKRGAGAGGVVTPPSVNPPASGVTHLGTATLPLTVPSYSYSPDQNGVTHTPTTAAQLATLLSGASLNGQTLQRGDTIVLTAGTTYNDATYNQQRFRNITTQRAGTTSPYIYVISSALASLPAGERVFPADSSNMPKFQQISNAGTPCIYWDPGACHEWVFAGIWFDSGTATAISRLVPIGGDGWAENTGWRTLSNYAYSVHFDRCYLKINRGSTSSTGPCLRFFTSRGNHVVTECYIENDAPDTENQAIGWDDCDSNTGGTLISNCTIIAGGENTMPGGTDSRWNSLLPSDVTIRRCHYYKPTEWRSLTGAGVVKNLFEMKIGKRWLVEYCYFENFWGPDQSHAVNLKSVNQGGGALENNAEVAHVTLRYNYWKNLSAWLKITGGQASSGGTIVGANNISVYHNLVVGHRYTTFGNLDCAFDYESTWTPSGTWYGVGGTVTVRKNTIMSDSADSGTIILLGDPNSPDPCDELVFTDNIVTGGNLVKADSTAFGDASLATCVTTYSVTKNALIGCASSGNPSGNLYPASIAAAGFTDAANRDYSLTSGSTLKGTASDGGDPGCDVAAVLAGTAGCLTGVWS